MLYNFIILPVNFYAAVSFAVNNHITWNEEEEMYLSAIAQMGWQIVI